MSYQSTTSASTSASRTAGAGRAATMTSRASGFTARWTGARNTSVADNRARRLDSPSDIVSKNDESLQPNCNDFDGHEEAK